MWQKVLLPCTEREHPDTFGSNSDMRKSLTARLLSNGVLNAHKSQHCVLVFVPEIEQVSSRALLDPTALLGRRRLRWVGAQTGKDEQHRSNSNYKLNQRK